MATALEIIAHLDRELRVDSFTDYGPNGLQVPGPETVGVVVTGVSASLELFEAAAQLGADLLVTHHGLLWDAAPRRIDRAQLERLRTLLDHDMALAAYHLPLDAHPELGNNALLARGLGAKDHEPFAEHRGAPIGRIARFPGDGLTLGELVGRVAELTERAPLVFDCGPPRVRRLGIVSGGGSTHLHEAASLGLDAFLTGEPTEWVMATARESGVSFLAAGHYATETLGVRALGALLAERFGVEHHFVDVPNPI
ncbi:MAG TPA: Nif3-like dinuclear metal center hexameric protein [Solirubrobacteraceae bacterium]|jgi:dinuclear metal center YbgI/SA1388 family protein|nr:Nif3-like dinuclear metal center hexameric protein [Solirubrobacteraceae bacterium]